MGFSKDCSVLAVVSYVPQATFLAFYNVKRTVGRDGGAGGPVCRFGGIAVTRLGTGEALDEGLLRTRLAGAVEGQKHHVIAAMALLQERAGAAVINHERAAA